MAEMPKQVLDKGNDDMNHHAKLISTAYVIAKKQGRLVYTNCHIIMIKLFLVLLQS